MGCPVHIWVPMAAAVAPAATAARHKLRAMLPQRRLNENPADHIEEMARWSPLAQPANTAEAPTD